VLRALVITNRPYAARSREPGVSTGVPKAVLVQVFARQTCNGSAIAVPLSKKLRIMDNGIIRCEDCYVRAREATARVDREITNVGGSLGGLKPSFVREQPCCRVQPCLAAWQHFSTISSGSFTILKPGTARASLCCPIPGACTVPVYSSFPFWPV
jgi:hypothetical protein